MTRPCNALPPVRGSYTPDAPLKDLVWFRSGGPAEFLFRPADSDDLATFLYAKPRDLNVSVVGVGSNLLVRDGGIRGVVVRLPAAFGGISLEGTRVRAGAAALDSAVARAAANAGVAGLEFLRGIPGTIGGALRMNAGCYGREIKDVLIEATAFDGEGNLHKLGLADMRYAYRSSGVPEDFIFVEAVFGGQEGEPSEIRARMDALLLERESSQPVRTKTGGSTFKNPAGHKAWQLIDQSGCRGLKMGRAKVSDLHCNFLINEADASSAEIEALGEEVRSRVKSKFGIDLEWEIKRVGIS
jgi:UDP-N-acetylmuramate dehydrogenase